MILKKVFKNYSKRDRNISYLLLSVITLVIIVNTVQGFIYKVKTSDSKSAYNEGLVGEVTQINPLFRDLNNINRDISSLIFSGLTKYNPENKSFEPDLATFTINKNSTVYTFTLKENLTWHDGKPITVDDIMFTYRTIIQNPGFQNSLLRQSLESVTIENTADNQVQFTLAKPNAFFISQTDVGILPKHIYEGVAINAIGKEVENNQLQMLIGSGPYKFSNLEQLDDNLTRVNLQLNKKYYDDIPSIKNIRFFVFPTDQDLLTYQNNINSVANLSYDLMDEIDSKKFTTNEYLLPQYTALFLNTDKPILQNRTVRVVLKRAANQSEAIAGLKDKQAISRPFFQFEAINEISIANAEVLTELLEDESWELNANNIYEKQEQTLELDLAVQVFSQNEKKNTEYKKVIENLVNIFSKIGIAITPSYYEGDQFAKILADRDFDLVLLGHSLGNNLDSYSFWHSSQTTASGLNLSNYKNIATDSLLENVRITSDINERNELLIKINEKLVYDVPAIFLYTDKHIFAVDNKVKNRKILPSYAFTSDRFYDIASWEIN